MQINFVTTQEMKFHIAEKYFEKFKGAYELVQCIMETPEIQNASVEEVARASALWATQQTSTPCITADFGGGIVALNGFPGPFIKYVNNWLRQEDYLALLGNTNNRSAYFEDAMAIAYPNGDSKVFSKKTPGSIAATADPNNPQWPLNSLFIPQGHSQTLGSMTYEQQLEFWGDGLWPEVVGYLKARS